MAMLPDPTPSPALDDLEELRPSVVRWAVRLAFLLALVALAVLIVTRVRRALVHARATRVLEGHGAEVQSEFWEDDAWKEGGRTEVNFNRAADTIADADLARLRDLIHVRSVEMSECGRITDAGLANLRGLTDLQQLYLGVVSSTDAPRGPRITDAGLDHLAALRGLRMLSLAGTRITDAGLGRLRGLSELEFLDLGNTRITDAGLGVIRALPKLRYVNLDGTRVSPQGVANLRRDRPILEINWEGGAWVPPKEAAPDGR